LVANGRFEKQTAGVQIAMAMRITVRHCSIYDCPRAGINIGDGCWGGHIIEYCDVFDTVKETGDHGSFNSWGRDRYWVSNIEEVNKRVAQNKALPLLDTVEPILLRNNRWRCDHGWDIDLDDGSSKYRIENNLSLKGGIKFRKGFCVGCSMHHEQQLVSSRVWFAKWDEVRHNISRPDNVHHAKVGARKWTSISSRCQGPEAGGRGRDAHSVAGDPQFINPAQGDFRVKDASPALKLGFKNFAMDQFGVVNPRLKALARTPKIDVRKSETPASKRDPAEVDWLGARIKNVVGMGEMSALGLPSEAGVLIVTAPPGSAAAKAGLRARDVIVKLDGKEVSERGDLAPLQAAAAGTRFRGDCASGRTNFIDPAFGGEEERWVMTIWRAWMALAGWSSVDARCVRFRAVGCPHRLRGWVGIRLSGRRSRAVFRRRVLEPDPIHDADGHDRCRRLRGRQFGADSSPDWRARLFPQDTSRRGRVRGIGVDDNFPDFVWFEPDRWGISGSRNRQADGKG
jgi:hypothetical protein